MKKQHNKEFFEKQKKILAALELIFLLASIISIIYIVGLGFFGKGSDEIIYAKLCGALFTFFTSLLLIIICQEEWTDAMNEETHLLLEEILKK